MTCPYILNAQALRFTQPLTKMSTRSKKIVRSARKANFTAICEPIV
jgi:hypothetical protein